MHGAVRQALEHVTSVVEIESGSATDNPMVLPDGRVISGGNYGQPCLLLGTTRIGFMFLRNISERRTARMRITIKAGCHRFWPKTEG